MKNTASKENILKKIRKALSHPVPLPFPQSEGNQTVFKPNGEELEVVFAREFSALQENSCTARMKPNWERSSKRSSTRWNGKRFIAGSPPRRYVVAPWFHKIWTGIFGEL
jgi:hypothetical protein